MNDWCWANKFLAIINLLCLKRSRLMSKRHFEEYITVTYVKGKGSIKNVASWSMLHGEKSTSPAQRVLVKFPSHLFLGPDLGPAAARNGGPSEKPDYAASISQRA